MYLTPKLIPLALTTGLALGLSGCASDANTATDANGAGSASATGNDYSSAQTVAESFLRDLQAENITQLVATLDQEPAEAKTIAKELNAYRGARISDATRISSWRITGMNDEGDEVTFAVRYKMKNGASGTGYVTANASDADDNLERPWLVDTSSLPKLQGPALKALYALQDEDYATLTEEKLVLQPKTREPVTVVGKYALPGTYSYKYTARLMEDEDHYAETHGADDICYTDDCEAVDLENMPGREDYGPRTTSGTDTVILRGDNGTP